MVSTGPDRDETILLRHPLPLTRDDEPAPERANRDGMSLHVSWDQYNTLVERLALNVHESGFDFNQIICIARGGLRVGDVLSRIYERPLAILSTHSYAAEGGTMRGELVIAEHMTMTSPRLGDRACCSSTTWSTRATRSRPSKRRCRSASRTSRRCKTAVLWWKACSVSKPDFHVDYLPDNPWIHQPFEVYDKLRPSGLKARLGA